MRSLITIGLIGAATGRRISGVQDSLQIDPAHHADVSDYLRNQGYEEETIHRVANFVSDKWPGDEPLEVSNRRMKAVQLLSLEERARFWNASGHLKHLQASSFTERTMIDTEQPHCGNLHHPDNHACRADVEWAHRDGRHQPGAAEIYFDINQYAMTSLSAATLDDFQRLFHCGMGQACALPPCGCTHPPCDMCGADDAVHDSNVGFEEQCSEHPACVGQSGECCPNSAGHYNDCCDVVPDREMVGGEPIFTERPNVPGQEIQSALHGGRYLGPLKNSRCRSPRVPSREVNGLTLNQCANLCTKGNRCKVFTWLNNNCKLYVDCRTQGSGDATMLFVKNTENMHPHYLPTRTVHGNNLHFFAIGDWGGASCPGHASMHYVHRQYLPGSERYDLDHNAQSLVADRMGALAAQVKPFMVLNAGDNFYWGGVFHESLGGQDVHDPVTFAQGFEDIYNHEDLMVPWLSIMGNHDYGGDGCFANVRAQFDYTIRDLLHNDRWKMPSPYYKHRINFDGFSAEFFMIDTNVEDSNSGRHGGICAQEICHEVFDRETTPRAECVQWFRSMWQAEQTWLRSAVAESTADWKILVGHHKPHGPVGHLYESIVEEFGVQLMVGSHTHEMAFYDSWHRGAPLLVVGAGGGAQGAPGCGGARYCSEPTGYGFVDLGINEKQLEITIHNHDGEIALHHYICMNGQPQETPC